MPLSLSDPDFPHGTTYGYRSSCRCDPCKAAKRQDWQDYRARQASPFEDFEGQAEPDQIAEMVKDLILRVRCDDCGDWHEGEDCPV